jgi:hypothetical protein
MGHRGRNYCARRMNGLMRKASAKGIDSSRVTTTTVDGAQVGRGLVNWRYFNRTRWDSFRIPDYAFGTESVEVLYANGSE